MKLLIMPNLSCNLKCEYCYLNSDKLSNIINKSKSNIIYKSEEWLEGIEWLEKNDYEITNVDISGGEPLLYKYIIELIQKLYNKYNFVCITSNLLFDIDKLIEQIDKRKIAITASLHIDNNGKPHKKFMSNLMKLRDNNFILNINFVSYPKQLYKYEMCKNLSSSMEIGCHLEPYIDYKKETIGLPEYNKKEYDYLLTNLTETDKNAILSAQKRGNSIMNCNVLKQYVIIVENGDVYPCLGMFFAGRNKLANIFKKEIYKNKKDLIPIKCDLFCPCAQNYRDEFR